MCILKYLQGRQRYRTVEFATRRGAVRAMVADSAAKRMIGLMHRGAINVDEAMLFAFPYAGRHGIWMYNMRFSIDVLWLDGHMRVIDMRRGLKPCGSILRCRTYYPVEPAFYVLEGKAGFAAQHSLRIGSVLAAKKK